MNHVIPNSLQKTLVQDECFDLELYRRFRAIARDEKLRTTFDRLIEAETHHVEIWQKHFPGIKAELGLRNRIKLGVLTFFARIGGDVFIRLVVEAVEIHGVRKYMDVANLIKDTPLEGDLAGILRDELRHEEEIVAGDSRAHITGDRIRSFLFGFNDGLVELTGAVVGFSVSLKNPKLVLMAGFTIMAAGAFSMGAGAFASSHAEKEVGDLEEAKDRFLQQEVTNHVSDNGASPLASSFIVGIAYIFGGLAPLLPYAMGDTSLLATLISSLLASFVVSWIIAFLSGMQARRRIFMNLFIVALAVGFSFISGRVVDHIVSNTH